MPESPALLDTLASYVPGLIRRRLAADPAALTAPVADGFQAAVVFADISGFTALAERLAQQGPAGAEDLTRLLNTYFGQLIDLITAHGGDVVKLAGDALVALWRVGDAGPPSPAGLQQATHRAAQCALEIQHKLNAVDVGGGVRLQLRVGVGAGEAFMAHIGGQYGRWEFLLAGTPLAEVSFTQKQAEPGQVVLSHSAWALIHDECLAQALEGGAARLDSLTVPLPLTPAPAHALTPAAESALRAYIPGVILDRLSAGQTAWLAELRRVTVIFLNLPDLNHTTPLERAQQTMHALQNDLYRYEGSINKLSVDDKGVTLIAALGLPPFAHEDDAARGVHAALDMQATLKRLGLRSAIGVTTGRAFCGSVGNSTRREYTMIGDIVNVAARLMQAAPDSVLCDAATFQASHTQVTYETLPPLALKGKAEPLPVYRARGQARTAVRSQTAIVGREAERLRLADGIQGLLRGSDGEIIIVEGEAGIGKSRLVDDLRRQADTMRVATLSGLGDAVEKSTAYHAWRGVFDQLFDLSLLTEPEARRRHIGDLLQLEPDIARLAPLLNPVLQLDLPDNEITRQMDGAVRADNTRDLMVRCLQQSVARSPKVLILEDAHWLDSASWALTLQVALRVRPLLFVIATRPFSAATPEFLQLIQLRQTRRLGLDTLSSDDTRALVCQRLGVSAVPETVLAFVLGKAEGNPFFTEELAYALRDSSLLRISGGDCRLAPAAGNLQALNFPDTVQGVITSRIDRLTPQQQLTLKAASVIGRVFAYRTLRDIHPIEADRPNLPAYLENLRELDITPLHSPEPDLAYLFKHVITWEVAYNLMLFAQRRELHKAVAEWYERTHAEELAPHFELLAHHWTKAEVPGQALEYSARAGEQALRNGAHREAVRFLQEALNLAAQNSTLAPPRLQLARWERELGQAFNGLGQLAEARQHLERGAALAGWPAPRTVAATLADTLGQALRQTAHRMFPGLFIGRAREPQREALLEAARIYDLLGVIHYLSNEPLPTVHATLCTLNLAESAGTSPELARAYANACTAAGVVPIHGLAQAYRLDAFQAAEAVGQPSARVWVMFATSFYSLGIGRWQEARDALGRVADMADQLGDHHQWAEASILLEQIKYYQGDFVGGARLAADLVTVSSHSGNSLHRAWGLTGQAENAVRLGLADQARQWLDEALELLTRNTDRTTEITAWGLRALAHLRLNDVERARQDADRAAALGAESSPTSHYLFDGFALPAEVYLTLWEQVGGRSTGPGKELGRAARKAVKALNSFAGTFPLAEARAEYCSGWFQRLAGNTSEAQNTWRRGLRAAERLTMPYEQALLFCALGQAAPRRSEERESLLRQARTMFAQLGAVDDRDRAERLLSEA